VSTKTKKRRVPKKKRIPGHNFKNGVRVIQILMVSNEYMQYRQKF
jgi:hypothetical protein